MFEEEVELLTVDSEKLAELENIINSSYSLGEWIRLLSMYKLNESWKKVDQTVERISRRFHLRQGFWIRESEEKIARMSQNSKEQIKGVMELFERGLEHGEYTQLAEKYASFLLSMYQQDRISLATGEAKLELLIAMFLEDPKSGSLFFNRLRKLYKIKAMPLAVVKTRKAYQRELSVPFESIDVVFDEYKKWESDEEELKKVEATYEQIKERLDVLLDNIKHQRLAGLHPKCALAVLATDHNFDQQTYLEIMKKLTPEQQLTILRRHSKSGKFFEQYLRLLNDLHPEQENVIDDQYKRFLASCDRRHRNYYQRLFLETIIRRINKHLITPQDQTYFDSWAQKIVYFREQITKFIEGSNEQARQYELYSLWADVEAFVLKDIPATHAISGAAMRLSKEANAYLQYAQRLIALGQLMEALQVLKNGIESSNTPHLLAKQYLRFHSIFGLRQLDLQENLPEAPEAKQRKKSDDDIYLSNSPTPQKKPPIQSPQNKPSKRPREPEAENQILNSKIEHDQKRRYHGDDGKTVFLKGLDHEFKDQDIIKLFENPEQIEEVRIVKDKQGKSKGICYVDFKSTEAALEECKIYRQHPAAGILMQMSKPPKQYAEERTIFLCGLPATADEQKVRALLSEYSDQVDEIRLVKNQQASKGYCYVQFRTEQLKKNAFTKLLHIKLVIDGKRILLEECDSTRQRSKKNNQVVFLDGLSYKATIEDIKDFFHFHEIKSINTVEIPRTENGKSKGIAYIEFEKFIDFQKSLDLKVGKIRGREFKILRSDRPITQKKYKQSQPERANPSNKSNGDQPLSNNDFSKLFGS